MLKESVFTNPNATAEYGGQCQNSKAVWSRRPEPRMPSRTRRAHSSDGSCAIALGQLRCAWLALVKEKLGREKISRLSVLFFASLCPMV